MLKELQREPFRLFFPLGILLAWAGVLHWLLLGLGVIDSYHSTFHAMTQIQGFLTCFVTGFLFTMIPRRTRTAPPATWELLLATAAPILTTAAAWREQWALAQAFWLSLVVVVIAFALRRFRSGKGMPIPNSFVWVPGALLLGMGGSILAGVGASLGPSTMWLHDLGRALVSQGMITGLILGVGGMLFPMLTRGGAAIVSPSIRAKLLHLLALAGFAASFWIEARVDRVAGLLLRAGVIATVLVFSAEMLRLPTRPELQRRLVWVAAWSLAAGPVLQAAFPGYRRAALHVTFIGGYALMTFAISIHVFLSQAPRVIAQPRGRVRALAMLMLGALCARGLMDLDPARFPLWISLAASCFLAATLVWASVVVPATRSASSGDAGHLSLRHINSSEAA